MVVQESENYTLRKSLAKTFDKKTIIMIVLAIALLYKIVTDLEITLNEMIEYAFQANTNLVLVGIFFAFFALAMDSLTWWVLLKASDIQASYLKSFRVFMSTWAYQLLIPGAGVAELVVRSSVGASSFEKNDGGQVSVGDILPSIMLHRLLGLLAAIPLMVYIAYALTEFLNVPSDTANLLLLFMTIFSLGVLILFMLIAGLPNQVSYVFQKIIAIPSMFFDSLTEKTKNWQVSIDEAIWEYCDGFKQLWKVKWAAVVGFVGVMIAAVSHWVSIAFIYWGMHIQIDFVNVAVISFVGGTLLALPLGIPGGEGIMEVYGIVVLKNYATAALSAATTFLTRMIRFYLVVLVGLVFFAKRKDLYIKKTILKGKDEEITQE